MPNNEGALISEVRLIMREYGICEKKARISDVSKPDIPVYYVLDCECSTDSSKSEECDDKLAKTSSSNFYTIDLSKKLKKVLAVNDCDKLNDKSDMQKPLQMHHYIITVAFLSMVVAFLFIFILIVVLQIEYQIFQHWRTILSNHRSLQLAFSSVESINLALATFANNVQENTFLFKIRSCFLVSWLHLAQKFQV